MGRRTILELGLLLLALEPRGSSRVASRLVLGMRQVELVRSVTHIDELVDWTEKGRERSRARAGLGGTGREEAAGAEWTSGLLSFDADSLTYDDRETCLDVDWQGKKELGGGCPESSFGEAVRVESPFQSAPKRLPSPSFS